MLQRVTYKIARLWRTAQSCLGTSLYLVTDEGGWIFHWIGQYLQRELGAAGLQARVIRNPLGFRNQLVHYVDRYSYLNGMHRQLHASNRIFMNWFHGKPEDPNPNIQKVLRAVSEAAGNLERIVISTEAARGVLTGLGIAPEKLVKIPLGVDLKHFRPFGGQARLELRNRIGVPPDSFCIGCFQKDGVGWAEGNEPKLEKGPDVLLEVIARLHDKHRNLFIVLTGPARGYVKSGLTRMGVPFVHEHLENYPDIVEYYQLLDTLIIPSREEGGPAAFLEAWACGVPVVSTRTGMPADMIQTGRNGFLSQVEDAQGLVQAVEILKTNPETRESIVASALRDVEAYGWKQVAAMYYEYLYKPYFPGRYAADP